MAACAAAASAAGAIALLSWVSPWWLCALALLPPIRWLHRGERLRRALRVARLALWRSADASAAVAGARQPPDPAWRRRALLAAVLSIALAEPLLPQRHPEVTLWVDDSLSMLMREPLAAATGPADGPTRLASGLALARQQLDRFAHSRVSVRTLSDPWRDRGALDDALPSALQAGAGRLEAAAPPAALLPPERLHWLVTDGTKPALLDWPADRRPDRVVRVGGATRNVGIERLSARRHPGDAQRVDVLLKLSNGGTAHESRELILGSEAGELGRWTRALAPGASAWITATVPRSTTLRAALQPGDALPEDDALELGLGALRARRVAVDRACPQALLVALQTHPALQAVEATADDADAALDCSGAASSRPTLRVRAERLPSRTSGAPTWSGGIATARQIDFAASPLAAARLRVGPGDTVLLAIGEEAVIVARAGAPTVLETSLAFAALGEQTPLLVNLMYEELFGAPLLDTIALVERAASASRVVPAAVGDVAATAPHRPASALQPWTRPLLATALLLLCWEVVALGRQSWRLRTRVQRPSP